MTDLVRMSAYVRARWRVAGGAQFPSAAVRQPRRVDVELLFGQAVMSSSASVTLADVSRPGMPLVYVNPAFERLTGYQAHEVQGLNCRFLQGEDTDPQAVGHLRSALLAGTDHTVVLRNYRKNGEPFWNELRLSPVVAETGEVTYYFGFQQDVTERVVTERRLGRLALHDDLTGLPNRTQLAEKLRRELQRAESLGTELAVIFIDLDGFKAVNDRLGHSVGDLALAAAAKRLLHALRDDDLLARYGGDEFVAVIAGLPRGAAHPATQRLREHIAHAFGTPLDAAGVKVEVGASIGVALFPEHGTSAADLISAADRAMYEEKVLRRGTR